MFVVFTLPIVVMDIYFIAFLGHNLEAKKAGEG